LIRRSYLGGGARLLHVYYRTGERQRAPGRRVCAFPQNSPSLRIVVPAPAGSQTALCQLDFTHAGAPSNITNDTEQIAPADSVRSQSDHTQVDITTARR